jgi:hypothetical protein
MTWSLGEIETEARKAARGAGLPWGIAEEAGKAARWLAAQGVDGLLALADLLDGHDGGRIAERIVVDADGRWHGDGRPLCPLGLGASLMDNAHRIGRGAIVTGPVARPVLLIPFLARAAQICGRPLRLSWPSGATVVSAGSEAVSCLEALSTSQVAGMQCARAGPTPAGAPARTGERAAAGVASAAGPRIDAFAQRTYVPASARSRLHGAGAGLVDND